MASRFFILGAVLSLAAALSVVPAQAASAASTSVSIALPSSGATLSGSQWFDAVPNGSGVTGVQFVLSNPSGPPENCQIGTTGSCLVGNATLTWIGWLVNWNTQNVPNGTYTLTVTVSPGNATTSIPITVSNPLPFMALPTNNSTVSGFQWLDCAPPPGVTDVSLVLQGASGPQILGAAEPTWFGWIGDWNSSSVANGPYSLFCGGSYPEGGMAFGPSISITVSN